MYLVGPLSDFFGFFEESLFVRVYVIHHERVEPLLERSEVGS